MIVSLNEIETGCYRAALGVGLSHGLAQDAAMIGVKLLSSRPDGLAIMLRALRFAEIHPVWQGDMNVVPSLVAGPIAADLSKVHPATPIEADEPEIIKLCLQDLPFVPPAAPVEVEGGQWRELQTLAARTYVPASDTSRLKGAGAGLLDDD
jgi:Protein of unknown function (DUF3726)